MAATYTFDIFSTLDGYGAHSGNWGGYWGKQGPEFLDRRLALYSETQRMVFGANTYRAHTQMLASTATPKSSSTGPPCMPEPEAPGRSPGGGVGSRQART